MQIHFQEITLDLMIVLAYYSDKKKQINRFVQNVAPARFLY